jgi:hypothetical protein
MTYFISRKYLLKRDYLQSECERRLVIYRFQHLVPYVVREDRAEVIGLMDCRRDLALLYARLSC